MCAGGSRYALAVCSRAGVVISLTGITGLVCIVLATFRYVVDFWFRWGGGRLVLLGYRMAMPAVVVAGCMSDCAPCELSRLFWMLGLIAKEQYCC